MSYLVHLQQFEGPLGLLLYLIRKEEMDIFDINVGEITNQYFDYIRQMKELDLEVAGEFVAMAATLIQIKSRMLLPQYNDEGEAIESEDPRKELVQKLLDYQKYQDAAKQLYERPLLGRDVFLRGTRENLYDSDEGEIIIEEDGLFSLISAYRKSVKRALKAVHRVKAKVQSIAERVMEVQHRLIVGTRVMLSELIQIGDAPKRTQLLVTFLSMLELGRMGYVSLFQSETYGEIYVDPIKPIERNVLERVQEFDSGDAEAIAKSIMDEAAEEKIDLAEAMQSAHDLVGDHVQLGLGESAAGPEGIADVEFAEALLRGETLAPEHVASDDEIFAAELEIDRGWGTDSALSIVAADVAPATDAEIQAEAEIVAEAQAGELAESSASPESIDQVSSESVESIYEVSSDYAMSSEIPLEDAVTSTSDSYAMFADSVAAGAEISAQAENVGLAAQIAASDEISAQAEITEPAAEIALHADSSEEEIAASAEVFAQAENVEPAASDEISAQAENVEPATEIALEAHDYIESTAEAAPEMRLADVELKSDDDLVIEPMAANDHEVIADAADAAIVQEPAAQEHGFHAETGKLNEQSLAQAEAPEADEHETLPANHRETRSGEGSAEA